MDINFEPHHVIAAIVVVLTSAGLAVALLQRQIAHLQKLKPFKDLPMPPSHWFYGHVGYLFQMDFEEGFKIVTTEYANEQGLSGHWMGNLPMMSIYNYEDARHILMTEYSRRELGILGRHLKAAGGEHNFLVTNGKEWKSTRDAIMRTFDNDFMMESRTVMKQTTDAMVESLKAKLRRGDDKVVDIQPLMKMITLDVFGRMAFGIDFECCASLAESKLARSFDFIFQEFARRLGDPFNPASFFYWIPSPANRRHKQERNVLFSFVSDIIEQERQKKSMQKNVVSRLMHAQSSLSGHSIDEVSSQFLFDNIMSLLFAGYDTTSIALTYALYLLAANPECQQTCLDELANKSLEDPGELVYCEAVIRETTRMFPPAPQTGRTVSRDKTLSGGFVIPKDTSIMVPIWSIHRDAKVFPKPLEFRPDRWVKLSDTDDEPYARKKWMERESMEKPVHEPGCTIPAANRKAFFAFSAGGRSCAGQKFAIQEAVIVLANLVKHFKFSLADPNFKPEVVSRGVLQMPKNGIPLVLEQRATA